MTEELKKYKAKQLRYKKPIVKDLNLWMIREELVIETLKAFDCDNVAINLESAKMPMIIEAEDSDFKAMVLPVVIH